MNHADRPRAREERAFVRSCAQGFDLNASHPKPEVCELWIERHARLLTRITPGREAPLVAFAEEEWVKETGRNPWSGELTEGEFADWGEFSEW
jgi:hypothetical protein